MNLDWPFISVLVALMGVLVSTSALWWEVRKSRTTPSGRLYADIHDNGTVYYLTVGWLGEGGAWDVLVLEHKDCTIAGERGAFLMPANTSITSVILPKSDNPVVRIYYRPFGGHQRGYIDQVNLRTHKQRRVHNPLPRARYWFQRLTGVRLTRP